MSTIYNNIDSQFVNILLKLEGYFFSVRELIIAIVALYIV